jgi:hypothetical protein
MPRRKGPDPDVVKRATEIMRAGTYLTEGPRLSPCECGQPRHVHTGRMAKRPEDLRHRYRRDPADAMAEAAMIADDRTIRETIAAYEKRKRARKYGNKPREGVGVSVSDNGRCPAQIMHRERGSKRNPTKPNGAWVGGAIHDKAEAAEKVLYPWRRLEWAIEVPGLDRKARIDKYDPITGVVDDTKSAGVAKWDRIGDEGPSDDMWGQVLIYGLLIERRGEFVSAVRISPVDRDKGRCEQFTRPWNDEARDLARTALAALLDIATALDNGDELPRTHSGPATDAICRDYCPFRRVCWNEEDAEDAGRSGESYTVLGPDPDDEAIEWAIAAHVEAKAAATAAKTEAEKKRALLVGIEAGTYGEVTVKTGFSVSYDHKTQAAGLLEWIKTPEHERGPWDTWAEPNKKLSPYPDTGHVRKAKTKATKASAAKAKAAIADVPMQAPPPDQETVTAPAGTA